MIWVKTDAGRTEMQARALVKERAQRNLLLVIDGTKSEEMLLANLAGIGPDDFAALQSLGLITPLTTVRAGGPTAVRSGTGPTPAPVPASTPASAPAETTADEGGALDYAQFTTELTQIISKELGLRGFVLTLAVEKASTPAELQAVAQRALTQIAERKGAASAAAARRRLFGN